MAMKTMQGDVYTLLPKNHIKVGDKLIFKADTTKFEDFNLADVKKKYKVISAIPSIDTSVCMLQTREFNNKLVSKYPDVQLITISRDLPFALTRGCESFLNPNHILLSDTNYRDFGNKTNLYFDFNNLLARSVIVLNENNEVIYLQIVNPVSSEPNYQEVYTFLDNL
ncbi:peroxiredoxin [Spiroplasma eriocheiris]|uniref:Thiol peroxidase n=1 Tax=Spiroplasma eriocheiris TaxID=315358 RepID=A0A0H3XI28_9MOLU|nr:peroxiredoxin [Spiroplasma eriocheiris]AHF57636.1 putative thiol peroxidase [Spiroplasma eriocheiris CCTCC M 207170]AKM54090.1 thiol peroxidase [Spiroplasma eriocheiris]